MADKTLFDWEPNDEFKNAQGAEEHMCIECKYLRTYNSSMLIDICEAVPRGMENMSRRQRFDIQKISLRKCSHFERNKVPEWLVKRQAENIKESISFMKKHYTGD